MKPIAKLNISPFPWRPYGWKGQFGQRCWTVESSRQTTVCELNRNEDTHPDACLLAAAPDMYECLLEAVEDKCRKCKASWYGECVTADGKDCEMVARWKSVLANAAGETV